MHRSQVFLLAMLAFVGGVAVESFGDVPFFLLAVFSALGACGVTFWRMEHSGILGFCGLLALCFVLGSARFSYEELRGEKFAANDLYDTHVVLRGVVVEEPDIREKNTRLVIDTKEAGRVLLFMQRYPSFSYGDEIEVAGIAKKPEQFSDFDYVAYLAKDRIFTVIYYPDMQLLSSGHGDIVRRSLFFAKRRFEENIRRVFREPHAAFLEGLLLGSRSRIPEQLLEAFHSTGVMHIIALSGFNITIIAASFTRFLRTCTLGPQWSFWVSLIVIVLFTIMTGGSPSVVRASCMGILVLLSKKEGRIYQGANALVFAGALMIFQNPLILRFDVAFQLSFLATFGILFISPRFEAYCMRIPDVFGLRFILASTLAAQVMTLPLLVFYFGELSLISPLVNVLILPLIPSIMFAGFSTGIIAFVSTHIAFITGYGTNVLIHVELGIIDMFSKFPAAMLHIHHVPIILVYAWYGGVLLWVLSLSLSRKKHTSMLPRLS